MNPFIIFLQIVVAFCLLNVWLMRFNKQSSYRGGNATSLKEEFIVYGLPLWFFYLVGFLKIGSSISLIACLWFPCLVFPTALLVSILMVGAIAMHIKVGDPLTKSLPAAFLLLCSAIICLGTFYYNYPVCFYS